MDFKQEPVERYYDVGEEIGNGQFAIVKRCKHKESGLEFAGKFIRKRRAKASKRGAVVEDIEREVAILREADHENIVKLFEVYENSQEVILILELVSGGELFEYLSECDKVDEDEAVVILMQILEGVRHLHERSILHMDLKPENLMLISKDSSRLKIIDFGLSRRLCHNIECREMLGTPEFVAPEVINYDALTLATDMWGIGVIAYILLSGCSPFLGNNKQETLSNVSAINFSFNNDHFANVSSHAKDFISKLLVREPRKRATVNECLSHPWINRKFCISKIKKLPRIKTKQRWKKLYHVVRACLYLQSLIRGKVIEPETETLITESKTMVILSEMEILNIDPETVKIESVMETMIIKPVMETAIIKAETETVIIKPKTETVLNKPETESVIIKAETETVIIKLKTETVLNKPETESVIIKPETETVIVNAETETAIVKAETESVIIKAETETVIIKPETETVIIKAETETVIIKPEMETVIINAETEIVVVKPETVISKSLNHDDVPVIVPETQKSSQEEENAKIFKELHFAAKQGNVKLFTDLIDRNKHIQINYPDVDNGFTLLHVAASGGHLSIVRCLQQRGFDLNSVDQNGVSALHVACRNGLLDIVEYLCGVSEVIINLQTKRERTALHMAAQCGHADVVRCLLFHEADMELIDKEGQSSHSIAMSMGHSEIIDIMARMKRGRQASYINQLQTNKKPLSCIKVKVFGSSGVGKTKVIESLKYGFFGGFLEKAFYRQKSNPGITKSKDETLANGVTNGIKHNSPSTAKRKTWIEPQDGYTHGVNIETISFTGSDRMSVWEFSGYEPYYVTYNHLIGDTNCLYVITMNLLQSDEVQLSQVVFWLNFLKARTRPHEPIGFAGSLPTLPTVLLVATHVDSVKCSRNVVDVSHDFFCETSSLLLQTVMQKFSSDFHVFPHLFTINAHNPSSNEVKTLRRTIIDLKRTICQNLSPSCRLSDAVLSTLPSWRQRLRHFPVVSWSDFVKFVRTRINVLSGMRHLWSVLYELQIIGEARLDVTFAPSQF